MVFFFLSNGAGIFFLRKEKALADRGEKFELGMGSPSKMTLNKFKNAQTI